MILRQFVEHYEPYTLVLKEDGTITAVGLDLPPIIKGLTGVKKIDTGRGFAVALDEDGSLVSWYDNDHVTRLILQGVTVKDIAVGDDHTVALLEDGSVNVWGSNLYGQLNMPEGLNGVKTISAGWAHTVALKEDGTVVAWGNNFFGQCDVPVGLTGVKEVAAGSDFTAVLKEDGTVVAWGNNNLGQCDVPEDLTGVTKIFAGYVCTALKEDGTVVFWDKQNQNHFELTDIKDIDMSSHFVALKVDGTIFYSGDYYTIPGGVKSISAATYCTSITIDEYIIDKGDLNADYTIDSSDITIMKKYLLGTIDDMPLVDDMYFADVNSDNSIDSTDLTLMKRFVLGIIDRFPGEKVIIMPTPQQ